MAADSSRPAKTLLSAGRREKNGSASGCRSDRAIPRVGPARGSHQKDRLARRYEPFGPGLTEAAAGLIEIQCTESVLAEVTVGAAVILVLADGHFDHPSNSVRVGSGSFPQIAGISFSQDLNNPQFGHPALAPGGEPPRPGT